MLMELVVYLFPFLFGFMVLAYFAEHVEQRPIRQAERLARLAHDGQVDKQGRPYAEHLSRVAEAVPLGAQPAAWLHDALEDTDWTPERLLAEGVHASVVETVVRLTRLPSEAYGAYIARVLSSGDPDAVLIKAADLRDNLRTGCPFELRERYVRALAVLDPKEASRG